MESGTACVKGRRATRDPPQSGTGQHLIPRAPSLCSCGCRPAVTCEHAPTRQHRSITTCTLLSGALGSRRKVRVPFLSVPGHSWASVPRARQAQVRTTQKDIACVLHVHRGFPCQEIQRDGHVVGICIASGVTSDQEMTKCARGSCRLQVKVVPFSVRDLSVLGFGVGVLRPPPWAPRVTVLLRSSELLGNALLSAQDRNLHSFSFHCSHSPL